MRRPVRNPLPPAHSDERIRNDERLGIAIGNFANEMTALYVTQHTPTNFADEAITEGIGPASRLPLKLGVFFFNYDLDGWPDLLTANGHLEDEITKIQKSQTHAQPAQLFWNAGAGQGGFLVVPPHKAGGDLFKPIVGRGSACADIDRDGDLDVVLTQIGGAPLVSTERSGSGASLAPGETHRNEVQPRRHWSVGRVASWRHHAEPPGHANAQLPFPVRAAGHIRAWARRGD